MAHIQYVLGAMGGSSVIVSPSATGSAVGSGNAVVGSVAWTGSGGLPSSIVDNKGNVYTILDSKLNFGPGDSLATFYGFNITNGPDAIAANWSSAISFPQVSWDEYSGSLNTVDGHSINGQTNPGTGTDAITSGNISPVGTSDVVWGTCINNNGQITRAIGTGYTLTGQDSSSADWGYISEGKTFGPGTTAVTFTDATNGSANTYLTAAVALASATIFTASLTESASAADSPTVHTFTASWTLTEAASAADNPSGLMTASWTLTEAGTASDSTSGSVGAPIAVSLAEIANAIDTLTFKLAALPPPPTPAGIYQPKDLQYAYQWLFNAQQALQAALATGDPSQIPQLLQQIQQWQQIILNLRAVQNLRVTAEATRQGLVFAVPLWPNSGEN